MATKGKAVATSPGIKSSVFSGRKVIRELLFSMLRRCSPVREVVAVVAGGGRAGEEPGVCETEAAR